MAPREDGSFRVLCVDPDEVTRAETVAALDQSPLSATGAPDAERARAIAAEERIDCVVCEHDLPAHAGLDLHDDLDAPAFLLYTGDGDEELAGAALAAGVDGYVPKAEGPERLHERVLGALDGAGIERPDHRGDDAVPFAVVEWDRDGRIVGCNDRTAALFGHDRAAIVGEGGTELLFGTRSRHGGLADAFEGETVRVVERNHTASGETVTCEWHTAPRFRDGEIVGAVSYVRAVGDGARRIEALEALKRTTGRLLRADSKAAVASATLEAVEGVLHQPIATVRLYDEDSEALEVVAATDEARALFDEFPPVTAGDGLIWDAYASGEHRRYEDPRLEDTVHDRPVPIEDAAIQPLGEYGVLTFGHTTSGAIDASDLHLARVLSTTAEAALDRTTVRAQLRDRKEKIESLHEVVHDLETCDTEAAVWDLAVDAAEGILAFDECGVDEYVDGYLVARATSSELLPDGYVERTPVTDGIAGKTYRTGTTELIDDLHERADATPEDDGYRSLLSVPIGDRGVFQAASAEVGAFDVEDTELAELLFAHVGNALDRLAAEVEMREERDRFAALFENVPDPVVFAEHEDDQPIVRSINGAFEETFGFDADTLRGEDLNEFVVPQEHLEEGREIDRVVTEKGLVVEREVTRRTDTGRREFHLTVVPIELGEQSNHTFCIYADITERKQRRQRVEVLNRVLRHDLRNGMNIVKGAAETLAGDVDPDERRDLANTVTGRANDLLETAEKTRTVERALSSDRGPVEPTDVVRVTRRACDAVRSEFPAATIEFDPGDRPFVAADDMLETALYHVLENACVHNDRDPEISVWIEAENDEATIHVADNGPGIPAGERELVTDDREITQLNHASGLGLWLVNWVVTRAGGSLTFRDRDPHGTVVSLRLPAPAERIST